jgi:hypothetical protein
MKVGRHMGMPFPGQLTFVNSFNKYSLICSKCYIKRWGKMRARLFWEGFLFKLMPESYVAIRYIKGTKDWSELYGHRD